MGATTIEPGGQTNVQFVLAMGMHRGMEGRHHFLITVPVQNAGGESGDIQLHVKAEFR